MLDLDGQRGYAKAKVDACNIHGSAFKCEMVKLLGSAELSDRSWCYKHEKFCHVRPSVQEMEDSVVIVLAGVDCTPWSERGSRHKWMKSSSTLSLLTLCREILTVQPTMSIIECSSRLPSDAFTDSLRFHNKLFPESAYFFEEERVCFDNRELGLPITRNRSFSAITDRKNAQPIVALMRGDFLKFAGRTNVMVPDDMLSGSDQDLLDHTLLLQKSRRTYGPVLDLNNIEERVTIAHLDSMSTQMTERLSSFIGATANYFASNVGSDTPTPSPVIDLSQSPTFTTISANWPPLTTKAMIYSMGLKRFATNAELFGAHGWAVPSSLPAGSKFADAFPFSDKLIFNRLPHTSAAHLAGNGMTMQGIGSVIQFKLMFCRFTRSSFLLHVLLQKGRKVFKLEARSEV